MRRTLFVILLLLSLSARGQTSIEEYRKGVEAYSWQLKMSKADIESATALEGKAYTGLLPSLSMSGKISGSVYKFAGVQPWSFNLQPQVIQTIYSGSAARVAYRQSQLSTDIAVCDDEFTMLDVRYAADYAYWTLSASDAFLTASTRYVNLIKSLKEVIDRRFREGYIAKSDVLMIDARFSEAEFSLVTAEQNYFVAMHNFNILSGRAAEQSVTLTNGINDSLAMPTRCSFAEVLSARPDFNASQLQNQFAWQSIKAACSPYLPQLSLGVAAAWQTFVPNAQGKTYVDGVAFLQLDVPIFYWGQRRKSVAAARAQYQKSLFQTAQLHDDIFRDESNAWTAIEQSAAAVASSERSLKIASENLEISTYSYNEGLVTILDVLQAQLSWIQLYDNYITAKYNYAIAISAYERISARR